MIKLKFICTEQELEVLKQALKSYPKNKDITKNFLEIIEYQAQ